MPCFAKNSLKEFELSGLIHRITVVLHVIFTLMFNFKPLIIDYGRPNMDDFPWTLRAIIVCNLLIQCPIQVRLLKGNRQYSLLTNG